MIWVRVRVERDRITKVDDLKRVKVNLFCQSMALTITPFTLTLTLSPTLTLLHRNHLALIKFLERRNRLYP
jgi:hypothetical protein